VSNHSQEVELVNLDKNNNPMVEWDTHDLPSEKLVPAKPANNRNRAQPSDMILEQEY
jgi:hypothetical protein